MFVRISRIFLLTIVILVAAVSLPHYYWLGFGERTNTPIIRYSPVSKKFLTARVGADQIQRWFSENGQELERPVVDSLMPFSNYIMLASHKAMPAVIDAIPIDLDAVRVNNFTFRIRQNAYDTPSIPLYPLFESRPERLKLEMPRQFFRMTDRMEFITAASNSIDESLTAAFTQSLTEAGFHFPAGQIYGNPNVRKPFDEGYFVTDAAQGLFHIKMIKGQPFCRKISLPDSITVKKIDLLEIELREFYGILVDQKNYVYLILTDNYRLQQLPLSDYNPKRDHFVIYGDLMNRTILLTSQKEARCFVTDRAYKLVARREESYSTWHESQAGVVNNFLFPFIIRLSDTTSGFINLYISGYNIQSLAAGAALAVLIICIMLWRRRDLRKKWYDPALVFFTGIFGFIAVLLIDNTD
jgi:hypothetical protein